MSVVALTVAGSDPSGGAGVQADLATFGALSAFGTAVLTALTAQSTAGVAGVHPVPAAFVTQQLEVLLDDVEVDAAKTGMLGSADVVAAVADVLARRPLPVLVVDPVMVATSGDRLLAEDAVEAVRDQLLPLADLLTPNLPEAAVLLGAAQARDPEEMADQARALLALGARGVLLKGGHAPPGPDGGGDVVDVLALPEEGGGAAVHHLVGARLRSRATHGTGCVLSAACAALRPRRQGWLETVTGARDHLVRAIAEGERLGVGRAARSGAGHGPVHHHAGWWDAATGDPVTAGGPA
ncbi:bifunctional hydroxymethylpyrimidine kinase/phosphomethylpyrimidine kinase [uncultured Pseudokineococcus sp.]|uniref:bifunctional hydroxymethylpyrimidine kinase/phosphomethylpyrimidine kinase n=1 Tax=uncultured Pseudokineococcus sp. TaxID=1642928 RepID=UPI0026381779|nr:bifunctional hydroxymethylpyrimidine kinase/phosphomethylpyrimidine kinase [uncultured Pseudokineococcus sp.]